MDWSSDSDSDYDEVLLVPYSSDNRFLGELNQPHSPPRTRNTSAPAWKQNRILCESPVTVPGHGRVRVFSTPPTTPPTPTPLIIAEHDHQNIIAQSQSHNPLDTKMTSTRELLLSIPASSEATVFIRVIKPPFSLNAKIVLFRDAQTIVKIWTAEDVMVLHCSDVTVAALVQDEEKMKSGGENAEWEFLTISPDDFEPVPETDGGIEDFLMDLEFPDDHLPIQDAANLASLPAGSAMGRIQITSSAPSSPTLNSNHYNTEADATIPMTPKASRFVLDHHLITKPLSVLGHRTATPPTPTRHSKRHAGTGEKSLLERFNEMYDAKEAQEEGEDAMNTKNGVDKQVPVSADVNKGIEDMEIDAVGIAGHELADTTTENGDVKKSKKRYDRKNGDFGGFKRKSADKAFAKSTEGKKGIMGLMTPWWNFDNA